jgi:hypothetical protein
MRGGNKWVKLGKKGKRGLNRRTAFSRSSFLVSAISFLPLFLDLDGVSNSLLRIGIGTQAGQ